MADQYGNIILPKPKLICYEYDDLVNMNVEELEDMDSAGSCGDDHHEEEKEDKTGF